MDYLLRFICLMLLATLTSSHSHHNDFFHYSNSEEYYDSSEEQTEKTETRKLKKDDSDTENKFQTSSIRPAAKYEVTEIVIDIPNPDIYKGPVITNFTIPRPLNNATITNRPDIYYTDKSEGTVEEEINKLKNYVSAIEEFVKRDDKHAHDKIHKFPNVAGSLKEYLYGVKKGIVHGFNNLLGNHFNDEDVSKFTAAPTSFLNKLHRKASDAAHKIHKAVFDHKDFDY